MKYIVVIILLFIASANLSVNYSETQGKLHPQGEYKISIFGLRDSDDNQKQILLSIGTGVSIFETSFIVSPDVIIKVYKNINILTGFDFYTNSESITESFSVNLIPYFVTNTSNKTIFQIGIGGSYFRRGFSPIFSTKFDFELTEKSYIGGEIKSLIVIGVDKYPFPLLLLNYSVKL